MTGAYPPADHLLRHLPVELEVVDATRSVAHVGAVPDRSVGALTTVVDVLAGSLVGRVVAPDWMATAQLSLHLAAPVPDDGLRVEAEVVRDGRTTVVVDARLVRTGGRDGPGEAVGEALLTFVRLPRRDANLDIAAFAPPPGSRSSFGPPEGPRRTFTELVGTTVEDPGTGRTTTPVTDRVRNSFGAVNGGVVAGVAEVSGRSAALAALGTSGAGGDATTDVATTDVLVHYLSQARSGPLSTRSSVLRASVAGALGRVEVVDGSGRRCALAHVAVA